MRRAIIGVLLLAGCSNNAPYCHSGFVDLTGIPPALCPGARDVAVCDRLGERARFEEGVRGLVLVGGEYAMCTRDFELVCPSGTSGDPYCITDPEA